MPKEYHLQQTSPESSISKQTKDIRKANKQIKFRGEKKKKTSVKEYIEIGPGQ